MTISGQLAPSQTERGGWSRMLRNGKFSFALLDQIVVSFGNMVVSAAVSRHCPSAEFGVFVLSLKALDFINQLCGVLIWGPYTFNMPGLPESRRKHYLGSVLAHQLTGCAMGVVTLLFLAVLLNQRGEQYHALFAPLAAPSIAIVFREFTRRMYFAHMAFRAAFFADTATVALQTLTILLLLQAHALHTSTAIWTLSLGCLPASVFWLISRRKSIEINLHSFREHFSLNLRLGQWFFASNMSNLVSQQANTWILSAMSGPSAVGNYNVCEAVVNIPRVALVSMQNTMGPSMARAYADGGKPALRHVVRRHGLLITACTLVFVGGIVIAGPDLARLIYHRAPPDARLILILLACNLLAYAASLGTSYGLSAVNQARLNFFAAVAGLMVQLALAWFLVKSNGLPGAAASLLLGSLVVLLVQSAFYFREMRRA